MTRPGYLWLSVATSALAHGALGWQLYFAPVKPSAKPDHDPFEVRMLTLPPPPPPAREPTPAPPEPLPPAPTKPRPMAPPPAPSKLAEPPVEAPEPTPQTAPPALLSDAPSATPGAGVVQIPGAPIGSLATTSMLGPRERIAVVQPAPARPPPVALAKLGDLSRKPRAPSLDASLRQHYPLDLRRRAVEGQAEVRVVISPRGLVDQVSILSESAPGFGQACKSTLLGTRWSEPLDREGKPVGTHLTYRCRFQIERG